MRSKIFFIRNGVIIVLLLLLLGGCDGLHLSGKSSTADTKSPTSIRVGFVSATSSLNFASEMADGARYAAQQFHVSAKIVAPAALDPPTEVKQFQNLITSAPDGIAVETLNPDMFVQSEASAVGKGIPIIAVDTVPPPETNITTYVGNDNIAAGAMLADAAIERLPKEAQGSVVVGNPVLALPVLAYRAQGIKEEFLRARPNFQVLGPFETALPPQPNLDAWNQVISGHSNMIAGLGVGDQDNVSLARIKQANHGTYLTAAFDLNEAALQAVANGTNYALGDPEHFLKGYVAMRLLIEHALSGKAIPKGWWNPGALLVTQNNVQDVIARQMNLTAKGRFYQPTIDKEFANPAQQIKPLDQAK